MMGFDFAQLVREYVHSQKQQPTAAAAAVDQIKSMMGNVAKIKSNPDKSKHLETATARLFGLDVDFVNLRSETYMLDNRIPQIVSFPFPSFCIVLM